MLAYQAGGATSSGPLPAHTHQRWRTMFTDEIEDPILGSENDMGGREMWSRTLLGLGRSPAADGSSG